MAEAEENPVVTQEEVPAEDSAPGGEKEKKKRNQKPPEKADPPNEEEYQKEKDFLEARIMEIQGEIDGVSRIVDEKSLTRTQARNQRKQLQEYMDESKVKREESNEIVNTQNKVLEEIEQSRSITRAQVRKYKQGLKFTNLKDANEAIGKIEYALTTGGFSIQKQQKLLNDLNMLKNQCPRIAEYTEQRMLAEMNKVDALGPRKEKDGALKTLAKIRAENNSKWLELKASRSKENGSNKEIEQLIKQRKEVSNQKYKIQQESKALTKSFGDAQWKYTRWSEYQKYLQRQQRREDYKVRQAEREQYKVQREEEEAKKPLYEREKQICDELITYLTYYLPASERPAEEEAAPKESEHSETVDVGERISAFTGKVGRAIAKEEEVSLFEGDIEVTNKFKRKRKNKNKGPEPLRHLPDIFTRYKAISMRPPGLTSEVSGGIDALKAKKEYFETAKPPAPKKKETTKAESLAEEKEVQANRRRSITAMDKEQKERIAQMKADADDEEATVQRERRSSIQLAVQLAEDERARRIQETSGTEDDATRRRNQELADQLAGEEQKRQVKEYNDQPEEDVDDRKENQRRASAMLDKEQMRRVQEFDAEPEEDDRTDNKRRASAMLDEEQMRRVREFQAEPEEADRSENVRRASIQIDAEQARRIQELKGYEEEDKAERVNNQRRASQIADSEKLLRSMESKGVRSKGEKDDLLDEIADSEIERIGDGGVFAMGELA